MPGLVRSGGSIIIEMIKHRIFDFALQNRRIRLIHTDDPWTKLKPDDMGTIRYTFDNLDDTCIAIEWDSGSTLSLVEGKDEY